MEFCHLVHLVKQCFMEQNYPKFPFHVFLDFPMRHIRSQWYRRKEQERKRRALHRHGVEKFRREMFNYEACESHTNSGISFIGNFHQHRSQYRRGDSKSEWQNKDCRSVMFEDTGNRDRERNKDVFDLKRIDFPSAPCNQRLDQNERIRKNNPFGQLPNSDLTAKSCSRNEQDFLRVAEENSVRNYERSVSLITNQGCFDQHFENRRNFECSAENMHHSDFQWNTKEEIYSFKETHRNYRHLLSERTNFLSENDFKSRCRSGSAIGTQGVSQKGFLDEPACGWNQSVPIFTDWRESPCLPTSDSVMGKFDIPTQQSSMLPGSVDTSVSQWSIAPMYPSYPCTLPRTDQNNYQQTCNQVQDNIYKFQRKHPSHTNLPYAYPHTVTSFSTENVKQGNPHNKGPESKQTNWSSSFASNNVSFPSQNVNGKDYFENHQEEQNYTCPHLPERGTSYQIGYYYSTESLNNTCHSPVDYHRNSPVSVNVQDYNYMALPAKSKDLQPNLLVKKSSNDYQSSFASDSCRVSDFQNTVMSSMNDKNSVECIENKEAQAEPCKRRQSEKEDRDRKRHHGLAMKEEKSCHKWTCHINYSESREGSCLKDDHDPLDSSQNGTQAHSFSKNCVASNFAKHERFQELTNTKESVFRPWTSRLDNDHPEIAATNCSIGKNKQQDTNCRNQERESKQEEGNDSREQNACTNMKKCINKNEMYKVNHQKLKMKDLKNFVSSKIQPTIVPECSALSSVRTHDSGSSAASEISASHQNFSEKLHSSCKDTIMRKWSEAHVRKPEVEVLERYQNYVNLNRLNSKNNSKTSSKWKKSFHSKHGMLSEKKQDILTPIVKMEKERTDGKSKHKRKGEVAANVEKKPCSCNIHPKLRHKIKEHVASQNETATSSRGLSNTILDGKLIVTSFETSYGTEGDTTAYNSPIKSDETSKTATETSNRRKSSPLYKNSADSKPFGKQVTDRVSTEASFEKTNSVEGNNPYSCSFAEHIKSDAHSKSQAQQKLSQKNVSKKKTTNERLKENHSLCKLETFTIKSRKSADASITKPVTQFTVDQPKNSTSIYSDKLSSQVPFVSSTYVYQEPLKIEDKKYREKKHPTYEYFSSDDHRYSGPAPERKRTSSETENVEGYHTRDKLAFNENNAMSSELIVDIPPCEIDSKHTSRGKDPYHPRKTVQTPKKNDSSHSVVSNNGKNFLDNDFSRMVNHPALSVVDSRDENDNCVSEPGASIVTPDVLSNSPSRFYPNPALPITLPFSMDVTNYLTSDFHLKYVQAKRELDVIDGKKSFLLPLPEQCKDQLLSSVPSSGVKQCPEVTVKKGSYEEYLDKTVEFKHSCLAKQKFDDYKTIQRQNCLLEVNSPSVLCSQENLDTIVESRSQKSVLIHNMVQEKEELTHSSNTTSFCNENLDDFAGPTVPFECDSTTQTIDEVRNNDASANTFDCGSENGIQRVIEEVISEEYLCSTNSSEIVDDFSWISDERFDEIANVYDGFGSVLSDNKESMERDTNYYNANPSRSPFRKASQRRHRYSKRFPVCLPRLKREKCQSEKALYESAVMFLGDFDKSNKRACRQTKEAEKPIVVTKQKNTAKYDSSSKMSHTKNDLTKEDTCMNSKNKHVKEHQEALKSEISSRECTESVLSKNNGTEENTRKTVEKLRIADLLSKCMEKVRKLEKGKLVSMRQHFDKRSRTNIAVRKEIDTICSKTPVVKMEQLNNREKYTVDREPECQSVEKCEKSEDVKLYQMCRVCKTSVYTSMKYHYCRFHKSWCFRCQKDLKELVSSLFYRSANNCWFSLF